MTRVLSNEHEQKSFRDDELGSWALNENYTWYASSYKTERFDLSLKQIFNNY